MSEVFLPVSFKILPQRQLIVFTYSGLIGMQELMDCIAACVQHPDYRPWMRQFCDLTDVIGVEQDFPKFLQMMAKIADDLQPTQSDLIVMFYAPTPAGQEMALRARASWDGLNSVIILI